MIHGKRLVVVMPAYNAEATVEKTLRDVPEGFVDDVVLVDDASRDGTAAVGERLGLHVVRHPKQPRLRREPEDVLPGGPAAGGRRGRDAPPGLPVQPRLVVAMASMIAVGQYDVVLASRILCGSAIKGGMPLYKYVMNRLLTLTQNLLMGAKVSEYHTGYRGFSRAVLESLPLEENSDDFVFDNEMLAQAQFFGFRTGELSVPGQVRAGVELDLVPTEREVRVRRPGHDGPIPAAKVGVGAVSNLRPRRPAAGRDGRRGTGGVAPLTTVLPFTAAAVAASVPEPPSPGEASR